MNFISVDQSLSKCTLLCWKGGVDEEMRMFRTGASKVKKKLKSVTYYDTVEEQIHHHCDLFVAAVREWQPQHIIFEGLSFASGGDQSRNLAGLYHSVVERLHSECGIPLENMHTVAPTSLKKFARKFLPEEEQRVGSKLVKMDKKLMVKACECAGGTQWVENLVMSASSERGGKDDAADCYLLGLYFKECIQERV